MCWGKKKKQISANSKSLELQKCNAGQTPQNIKGESPALCVRKWRSTKFKLLTRLEAPQLVVAASVIIRSS